MLDTCPPDTPTLPTDVLDGIDQEPVETSPFVFVDGFGYDQWCRIEDDQHLRTPMLSAFSERGTVTPLTTIFPSMTAAAIPTIKTGQYPVEHGLLGDYFRDHVT
jgi:predicted AlkP superfamily pyrophosphatase or phosphodiesterase